MRDKIDLARIDTKLHDEDPIIISLEYVEKGQHHVKTGTRQLVGRDSKTEEFLSQRPTGYADGQPGIDAAMSHIVSYYGSCTVWRLKILLDAKPVPDGRPEVINSEPTNGDEQFVQDVARMSLSTEMSADDLVGAEEVLDGLIERARKLCEVAR